MCVAINPRMGANPHDRRKRSSHPHRCPLGTFTIYESKAPEGYLPSNDSWSYTVGADQLGDSGVVEIESRVSDIPIAFDLEISKFKDYGNSDQSGLEQPAGGVVFEVVSNSSQQVVGTLTTNIYGFASTKDQSEAWFGAGKRPAGVHGAIPYDRAGYTVREVPETVPEGFKRAGNGPSGPIRFPTAPSFNISWTTTLCRRISKL